MRNSVALVALMFAAAPALAGTVVINGDTTGGPTYNRPLAGSPPTTLSAVGTAVHYEVTAFTVDADGAYDLNSVASGYDNFLGLHSVAFDPDAPLTNALIYNDDRPTIGISGFVFNLQAGVSYFAVASGFENDDFGAYALTITGPGDITVGGNAVPEPATWAMMIAGFGLAGAAMRRRATRVGYAA